MFNRTRVTRCASLASLAALVSVTLVADAQAQELAAVAGSSPSAGTRRAVTHRGRAISPIPRRDSAPPVADADARLGRRFSVRPRAEALPDPAAALFCARPIQTSTSADRACEEYVAVPLATPAPAKPTAARPRPGTAFRLQLGRDTRTADALRSPITVDEHNALESAPREGVSNGFEELPSTHIRAEQEILNVLADLIGSSGTGRSSDWMPDISRHRGALAVIELERSHERATYQEVEAFKGREDIDRFDPIFIAGASLAILGTSLDLAIDTPDDGSDFVTPKPRFWPPGIRLKGRFSWP